MKKSFLLLLVIGFWFTGCNLPKPRTPTLQSTRTQPPILEETATFTLPLPDPTETPTLVPQAGITVTGTRTYDAVFEVVLVNNGSRAADRIRLVVALISDREPFQRVVSMNISESYTLESDEYDNQYAVFEFNDFAAGRETTLRFAYRVEVNALVYNLGSCSGETIGTDIFPETYIESDAAEISASAQSLAEGKTDVCQAARAYYDYVAENMEYIGYNPGEVGALEAISSLGGDCTEFSDLTTALLRAGGIPARPMEGLTCCTTSEEYSAGNIKHNWLLAYLPGVGWAPLDPTWGRFENQRDDFFAAIDDQHIILTVGRNPAPMNGFHGYTYTWWGNDVVIDNEENWSVLEVID